MNGLTGTRRLARPVRLVLAPELGCDIDGAWWPHTGSVAGELPELIETLHKTLGEVIDIRVNWAATDGTLDYNSILSSTRTKNPTPRRPHRLMVVAGRSASAKLLVIPHMTTPALGAMVMRCAIGRPNDGLPECGQWSEAADTVIRDAQSDSAAWAAQA